MSTTEERIAAAFAAQAGEISMETSTIERRLAEVRERTQQDRRGRRRLTVVAGGLAVAAAAAAALTLGGTLLDDDDRALPGPAEQAPAEVVPLPPGSGNPGPGTYSADSMVPLTFTLPELDGVPGAWHYEYGADAFGVGLDRSVPTGHANLRMSLLTQVYDPASPLPYGEATPLVAAPADVAGWLSWLEATGAVEVVERSEVVVDGAPATRLRLQVAADVPGSGFPCVPDESCVALAPEGPSLVAEGRFGAVTTEMTLLPVGDRLLVVVALGRTDSEGDWLPLLRSVLESVDVA